MAHAPDPHHPGTDTGALIPALFVSAIVAVCVIVAFAVTAPEVIPVDESSFALEPVNIDSGLLTEARAKKYAAVDVKHPNVVMFQNTVRAANLLQFEEPSRKQIQDAEVAVEFAANEAATAMGGYKNFVEFASPLYHACQTEMVRVLDAIASGRTDIQTMGSEPGPEFAVYREVCGNVVPMLVEVGLLTPEGAWRDAKFGPLMLDILMRLRIATIIQLRNPPLMQLTPYEREIVWRWRIEDPHSYTPKQRLRYLERGLAQTAVDEYPTPVDAARVYYHDGQKRRAWDVMLPTCKSAKNDAQIQQYCAYLSEFQTAGDPKSR